MQATPSWDFTRSPFGVLMVVEMAEARGMPAARALSSTGLRRADLGRSDLQVAASQELAVIRNVVRGLGGIPGLGVEAGTRVTLGMLGSWGFGMLNSGSGRDAVDLALRYGYGHQSFVFAEPTVRERGGEVLIVLDSHEIPAEVRTFVIERDLAAQVSLIPLLLGRGVGGRVETSLPPGSAAVLAEALAPVVVEGCWGHDAIVIPRAVLDRPLPNADPYALQRWRAECEALLGRRTREGSSSGLAAAVRAVLERDAEGVPGLGDVATALLVSQRTLRRRLAGEGTSFRAVVDEVRMARARTLLDAGEPVATVARRLGYAEPASFIRAYKRQAGTTPGARRAAD